MSGTLADLLSYTLMVKAGEHLKPRLMRKASEKKKARLDSLGERIDKAKFVNFLQNASDELFREYSTLRGQNILFRVLALAQLFLGGLSFFGC